MSYESPTSYYLPTFITTDVNNVEDKDKRPFTTYRELGAIDEIDYRFREIVRSLNDFLKKYPRFKIYVYPSYFKTSKKEKHLTDVTFSIPKKIKDYLKTTKLQQQKPGTNFYNLRENQVRNLADSVQVLFLLAEE